MPESERSPQPLSRETAMRNSAQGIPAADLLGEQISALLARSVAPHGLARPLRAVLKELELQRSPQAGQKVWPNGSDGSSPAKVQIGGGTRLLDGFLNIDAVPPADLLWDVREGIPLGDDTVELLFSEHFLDLLDFPRSAKEYARESLRVLAPGGRIVTGVRDAAFVLRNYSKPSKRFDNVYLDLINHVFRGGDDDFRTWSYDQGELVQLFSEAGFETIGVWDFDPSVANPAREMGSVYVVATK
ncbi:class I SAM-dependent methyltransferase [Streptomyces fildesensis]|uniref:Class I SAM-dependent methyltransferase n=1 Tax=Streptomyces fildesensis TaxID=375757 RepID=A0ABW8CG64_9ACTN